LLWLFNDISKESLAECSFGLWSDLIDFLSMLDKNEQTGEFLISSFKAWTGCFGKVACESSAYSKGSRLRAESWL